MTVSCEKCKKEFVGNEYTFYCEVCTVERIQVAKKVDVEHKGSIPPKGNFQAFEESAREVELVTPYGKVKVLVAKYNP
jgi:hypothetical protein